MDRSRPTRSPKPMAADNLGAATVPVTRAVLRPCKGIVGALNLLEVRGKDFVVVVHDRAVVFPASSEEARTIQDELGDVPLGTKVGLFCFNEDGRDRIFVRVKEGE